MDKKMMYKAPRAEVRGVFLCENWAVSHCPVIGTVEYLDYDDEFVDVLTPVGRDVIIF
jgi:hypothetical protein